MWIELNELIELAKATGTTDARTVNIIIDVQDHVLQRQREKAEYSRRKAEGAGASQGLAKTSPPDVFQRMGPTSLHLPRAKAS
jgi:hypothetical protein